MEREENTDRRKRGRPTLHDPINPSVSATTTKRRLLEELLIFTPGGQNASPLDTENPGSPPVCSDDGNDLDGTRRSEHSQQDPTAREVASFSCDDHSQSYSPYPSELASGRSVSEVDCEQSLGSNEQVVRETVEGSSLSGTQGDEQLGTLNSGVDESSALDVANDYYPGVYSSACSEDLCDILDTGVLIFNCDSCLRCTCRTCDVCAHHDEGECVHCDDCGDGDSECCDTHSFYSCFDDTEDFDNSDEEMVSAEDARNAAIKEDLVDIALKHNLTHAALGDILLFCRKYQLGQLPRCASTLLKTSRSTVTRTVSPGEYWHNGLTSLVKYHVDKYKCQHVDVEFFIDGLPISNSSNSSFWPILCSFNESSEVHLVGSYCGVSKPSDPNEYMQEFVHELKVLCKEGLFHGGNTITVACKKGIGDTPARNFFLNVKGHTSYCGCHKCMVQGEMCGRRMAFLDSDARLRSDEDFVNQVQEDYHKGVTVLEQIPNFGLVSCVPLDYMHLILLGVMKKLLYMWIQGPLTVRLPSRTVLAISEVLVQFSLWVPKEFVRKTRSLEFVKRFKATEFRMLLLYVLPVILPGRLPLKLFQHFLLLHVAVVIMTDPILCQLYIKEAKEYCLYFVETFKDLYGCEYVSYNIHALIHIANDVKKYGSLDRFCAFKYENFLQSLLKIIHRGRKPLQQLASRCSEFGRLLNSKQTQKVDVENPEVSGFHTNGPLPHDCIGPQLKLCKLPGYVEVNLSEANNCVKLVSGSIVVVKNFAHDRGGNQVLIGREFTEVSDLYTEPAESSLLDVYTGCSEIGVGK